jgi:hypothetical protein
MALKTLKFVRKAEFVIMSGAANTSLVKIQFKWYVFSVTEAFL